MATTIHWTKELRAVATAHGREDVEPLPSVTRSWAALKKTLKPQPNGFNSQRSRFEIARKNSAQAMTEILDRAWAFVSAETLPEKAPDAEAAGYALATYWLQPGASALFDVLASYSATLVHDAVIFAQGLKPMNAAGNYGVYFFIREPRDGSIAASEVRCALLRAGDAEREACAARAETLFATADFHLKATLAVAHPWQPAWAAEVGRAILADTKMRYPPLALVFMSLRDFDLVEPLLARRAYMQASPWLDLVEAFGEKMIPILMRIVESPSDRNELKHVARALSVFEDPAIARTFARHLGKKQVREAALPYVMRFPELAVPALREAAAGKTKAARFATQLLEQHERKAAVDAVPSDAIPADEATDEELPWILVTPPWLRSSKRKRKADATIVEVELLERPESVDIPAEIRTSLLNMINAPNVQPMSDEEIAAWDASLARGDLVGLWVHAGKLVPKERAVRAFNEGKANVGSNADSDPWVALAHVGLDAMPGVLRYLETRFAKSTNRYWWSAIHGVDSPRIAAALVPHVDGSHRALVQLWIGEHREAAIVALVRAAVGGDEKAAATLRTMADSHRTRIEAVADEYGADARTALDAILDRDPRLDCPAKAPSLPDTWRPETLHRPRLAASGKLVPLAKLDLVAHMLKFTDLVPTYPGLRDVVLACDPRSIAEFAWSLAEGWELNGSKRKDIWMLESIAHLADDEIARRTTPALKDPHIVTVLGALGTDAAAMELATIIARTSSPYGADRAEAQLDAIAKRRGLSKDELEDRITPTAGLDPDGTTTLDYGSRTLGVGFDTRLEPFVVWESGERQRQLPPKRKSDDAAKVKLAQAKWSDLKEDVATIADRRSRAIERSMLSGRSWSKDEFVRYWVEHPLLVHMAQGIVWNVVEKNGGLGRSFRVAEDHTFADERDEPVAIAEDARVVVPHRFELASPEAWHRVFEDYRIVPPIDQLTRAVHAVPESEAKATRIERPLATTMTYHQLDGTIASVGFKNAAWAGNMRSVKMALGRSKSIAVVEYPYNQPQLSSVALRFTTERGAAITPSDVHPVEFSEVVRAIGTIAVAAPV